MILDEEHQQWWKGLSQALDTESRFLREASAQSRIHDPKDPAPSTAALAAAMTLEGISGAIGKALESSRKDPRAITIEIRGQGEVWAAKSGDRTALGVSPLDAIQGVLDPTTKAFQPV